MKNIIACILLTIQSTAYAVIHGQEQPANEVFTIKLNIHHQHWLNSVSEWEKYESTCSSVIVGTQPLTVITAGHCLKEVALDSDRQLPIVTIAGTNFNLKDDIPISAMLFIIRSVKFRTT